MPDGNDPKLTNTGPGAVAAHGGVAAGAGGVAVGGNVEGGIHYHEAAEPSLLTAAPPRPPAHFTGREDDIERLTKLIASGESVAITALQGMGGIGKTALAQKLASRLRDRFPGGVLWWTLGQQPDVITALDVWARHADLKADLSQYPEADMRAAMVRSMLSRMREKLGALCAIIDDVWIAAPARALISALPHDCPILITTRDGDVAKALRCRVERIDRLTADESAALLAKLLGPLGEQEPVARTIAGLTDGLPLALELIAGLADSLADLPALAIRLGEKPVLDILKLPGGEKRETSVEACLALSYAALNPGLQRRFRALGVFAPAPFDRVAINAVWGGDEGRTNSISKIIRRLQKTIERMRGKRERDLVGESIHALIRRNLLTKDETTDQYTQHTLLRSYALALLDRAGEHRGAAARHADYYRQLAEEKHWRDIEKAFDQIDWGWRWVQAYSRDRILGYVFAVRRFLNTRGRKAALLGWLKTALPQARVARDRKAEGTVLSNIGSMYDDLGQKQTALEYFQQALAVRREIGDQRGEGTTINSIGVIYSALGEPQTALEYHQQALAIRREIGDRNGEGISLASIGAVYFALGQKQAAADCFQQSLAINHEVGNRRGKAIALNNLGAVYEEIGEPLIAFDHYWQALAIFREIGDRWYEAMQLFNVGLLHDTIGRSAGALTYLEQAVALEEEIGHPGLESDRAVLDRVRQKMGRGTSGE